MTLNLKSLNLAPPVFLAPLAGITDLPFRNIVGRFGAGLVVSEMVASQEMVQAKPGVRERAELGFNVGNTAVQIAGREAYWMAEAARMIEANGAKMIDINMGCPAKKVTNGYAGSALLRTPDHALSLIEAVVGATSLPVTLKTRLGWDDTNHNAAQVAARAVEAGIQMVTIHGRTRCQFYKGAADWAAISQVADAVDVPVIANGDIIDTVTAKRALQASRAQGVMIGRGAQGRPWVLAEVAANLNGEPDGQYSINKAPNKPDFIYMVQGHYDAMLTFYGAELGSRVARKHLGWYMDQATPDSSLRKSVLTQTNPKRVFALIADALDSYKAAA